MAANALNFGSKVVFLNGLPMTLPVAAADPGSAVAGDLYYNSVSGMVKYYNGSAWQSLTTGASGANTALSNLASVAINTSLLPGADNSINLGSASFSWASGNIHLLSDASGTAIDIYNRALIDSGAATQLSWSTSGVEFNQLTASTVPYLNSSKILTSSVVTPTELSYVSGVTSSIQTQLNGKQATGNYITALTGDVTAAGPGSVAATLATVNSNVGSFGGASSVPSFTVNAKGLITAASATAVVAPAGTLSGTTLNSTVVTSSLTSLGTQSQALNMGGFQINAVATPTSSTDAANKGYVDAAINGLYWKGPVQAYANSNVPRTGAATLTIDGYSAQNGDLVLLGNQTTASQNGEYTVSGIGTAYVLTANGQPTAAGDAWLVLNGTVYANSAFVATAAVPAAMFVEFAGPTALVFNAPLSITGNTVSISQAGTSTNGYLSSTDWNTFNNKQPAGNYITALTGDVTASGPGSAAATLATVNGAPGTFAIATVTVNGKGLVTSASAASTTGSGNVVLATSPSLTTPNIGAASGTSLNLSGLTAGEAVFTDGSKNLVSNAITGTGNVVMSASPTLTGTIGAAAMTMSGLLTVSSIASTGAMSLDANSGTSAIQLEALNFQRSTDGTNFITETYVDSTTLTDGSGPTAITAFQFAVGTYSGEEITYVIEAPGGANTGDVRVGTLRITANSTGTITPSISDMYTESADCGVTWTATNSGGTISVKYTTTTQGGHNRTMRADCKFFRA